MGMGRTGGTPRYGQLENQVFVLGISATGIISEKEHEELIRVERFGPWEKQEEEPASVVRAGEGRSN